MTSSEAAMMPSGMLIQKIALQLTWVAISPPIIGPMMAALPNVLEM